MGGQWHEATAELRLVPHPGEDITVLGELVATDASVGWLGITVNGAREA